MPCYSNVRLRWRAHHAWSFHCLVPGYSAGEAEHVHSLFFASNVASICAGLHSHFFLHDAQHASWYPRGGSCQHRRRPGTFFAWFACSWKASACLTCLRTVKVAVFLCLWLGSVAARRKEQGKEHCCPTGKGKAHLLNYSSSLHSCHSCHS